MRRFLLSILGLSLLFTGLGAIVQDVGARFKSDEKALELIRMARIAIGGETALSEVKSLLITGKSYNAEGGEGSARGLSAETEIAIQLPGRFSKRITKIADGSDAATGSNAQTQRVEIIRQADGADFIFDKADGETSLPEGEKILVFKSKDGENLEAVPEGKQKMFLRFGESGNGEWENDNGETVKLEEQNAVFGRISGAGSLQSNELQRLLIGLLLRTPDEAAASYTFEGENLVGGNAANVVGIHSDQGDMKLYLDKATNLPVMLSFSGVGLAQFMTFDKKPEPDSANPESPIVLFSRKKMEILPQEETQLRFSDFRAVGGILLPYKWTTSTEGVIEETFEITSYEINPANINDRFTDGKFKVRWSKNQNSQKEQN